jgi:hypothetical protein
MSRQQQLPSWRLTTRLSSPVKSCALPAEDFSKKRLQRVGDTILLCSSRVLWNLQIGRFKSEENNALTFLRAIVEASLRWIFA